MRVVFFGSGSPLSVIVLRELARRHDVAAVVHPHERHGMLSRVARMIRRRVDEPLVSAAKENGARELPLDRARLDDLRRKLTALKADLIAIASFPMLIPEALIRTAARGAVNLHQSRLPRGRGPDPIFWAYYDDDREIGSTVHWVDQQFDHGDVISQLTVPIRRGHPSTELYYELSRLGGTQLSDAIAAIESGQATRTPQDESLATYGPSPLREPWKLQFDVWTAERTWHFLAGVGEMFGRFARDPDGNPFPIGTALSYTNEAHGKEPGRFERIASDRVRLYCADGFVDARS